MNKVLSYMLKYKAIHGYCPEKTAFQNLPPKARVEIFKDTPIESVDAEILVLMTEAFCESGDTQSASAFKEYFFSIGVIDAFQMGGLEALINAPYKKLEGNKKTYNEALSSYEYYKKNGNAEFINLLIDYCQENYLDEKE